QKTWGPEDLDSLEQRFRKIRDGLERLMATAEEEDPIRIFLRDARPVVDSILLEHGRGAIRQDLRFLFWSYAHMMTNRLGVEANPEAILRFFMFRLLEERSRSAA
ncbi:MAG TPA: lantibiotic dehydratase C-terminal domain-containing protein, partial [Candidatus Polarisedimenticolia bacterium]|nr:lantibiotic dehydratase C-terminal domain-containing protein [Candidatus Polarisedimenticolia bacterium]